MKYLFYDDVAICACVFGNKSYGVAQCFLEYFSSNLLIMNVARKISHLLGCLEMLIARL